MGPPVKVRRYRCCCHMHDSFNSFRLDVRWHGRVPPDELRMIQPVPLFQRRGGSRGWPSGCSRKTRRGKGRHKSLVDTPRFMVARGIENAKRTRRSRIKKRARVAEWPTAQTYKFE